MQLILFLKRWSLSIREAPPFQDDYIEKYFAEKELDLTATLDAELAYSSADFVILATPTDCAAIMIQ